MTENCAITTQLDAKISHKPGSVGIPQPEVNIKTDPESGEILMQGPFMMKGYYKQPELTDEVIKDGWLHTGDQGYIDEDGFLFITGRVKDMFKTSKGKYIEPLLLEAYFADIVDLEQICVAGLGLPQPILLGVASEVGKAKGDKALEEMLAKRLDEVNAQLSGYKKIATVIVTKDEWTVDNGLTTPTLKIKRNQVDKKYQTNYQDWYASDQKVIFEA